jgi:hypothetical protein
MIEQHYIDDAVAQLRRLKDSADASIRQVADEHLFAMLDPDANSIALIMKHVAGNMRSRWTDFLTSDGEKPNRQRDTEFELDEHDTRERLVSVWDAGWTLTLETIAGLGPRDLSKTVRIRGQGLSVVQAINRQLTHYAEHVGQIVLLAKHHAGSGWKTLSIPKRKPN